MIAHRLTDIIFIYIIFLITGIVSLQSQSITASSIYGMISETQDVPLSGVYVSLKHIPSGTMLKTISRDDGWFNLTNIKAGGPYTLEVYRIGKKRQRIENFTIALSQNLRFDFTLQDEAIPTEEIIITGKYEYPSVTIKANSITNVSRTELDYLSSINRSFSDYTRLSSLFVGNNAIGRSLHYNNIQIDGANYNDLYGLGETGTPAGQTNATPISLDAIEEFQIAVSPYDVRYGGFTGAGINAITRSGSNTLSGSIFSYNQNQNLVGKSPDDLKQRLAGFSDLKNGFRFSGPILKNKLFFFLNGELTRFQTSVNRSFSAPVPGTNLYTLPAESVQIFVDTLRMRYNYDPGSYTKIGFQRESNKLFARFDFNINENNRITLRHSYLDAMNDNSPSYYGVYAENTKYLTKNKTNSTVFQLFSTLSEKMSNELIIGYTSIRDNSSYYGAPFPFIQVRIRDPFNNETTLQAGSENFRVATGLNQDYFEFTNNFIFYYKNHILTFGTHNEFFRFDNLFIQDGFGNYTFNSLTDFLNSKPSYYSYSYSKTQDPRQRFRWNAYHYGIYAQDDWNLSKKIQITFGARIELPIFPDKPPRNKTVDSTFSLLGYNVSTDRLPESNLLISPRFALSWNLDDYRNTTINAGIGLFTGKLRYVWISGQYFNTGIEYARLSVYNPPTGFVSDAYNQPTGYTSTTEINVTEPNFKLPQILKTNIGLEQKLPFGLRATFEGLYNRSMNEILYQNINLKEPQSNNGLTPNGKLNGDGRYIYGIYNPPSAYVPYANWKTQKWITNFTNVLLLRNTTQGSSLFLTTSIHRTLMEDGFTANLSYTYGISKDLNSGIDASAFLSWAFNHIGLNPNAPQFSTSVYERRHKIFGMLTYSFKWLDNFKTTLGVTYTGISGRPYSFVYLGDINGDGGWENDLAYIPKNRNDVILINPTDGSLLPFSDASYDKLDNYITNDDYLKNHRGEIAERMGAHEPWSNQIDVRISQEIPTFDMGKVELTIDIINVLNLFDSNIGWIREVPRQRAFLLGFHSLDDNPNSPTYGRPRFIWSNQPQDPSIPNNLLSRWQAQLGVRYTF